MPPNDRFTDPLETRPLPRTQADWERYHGEDAYWIGYDRDPSKPAAWLEGYDAAAAKDRARSAGQPNS